MAMDLSKMQAQTNGKPAQRHRFGEAFAACRFYVEIGKGGGESKEIVAAFTEVSGLQVEMDVMNYEEGGNNDYVHRLPGRLKISNVTLKRGLTRSNEFLHWCLHPTRRNISVVMYNVAGHAVVRFNFNEAYPVKWVGPQFTADSTAMAIETVELAHKGFTVEAQ